MESGAILMYLANKTGKLLSPMGDKYWEQMEWLMLQMGSIGPMLGQTHHFVKFNPGKSPYAEERYSKENARLYQVLENRLQDREFICDEYSIVDIATWPWISRFEFQQMNLSDYPNLKRWYLNIASRPAVHRGLWCAGCIGSAVARVGRLSRQCELDKTSQELGSNA